MSHLRRWGAPYILLVLFLGSWLGQFAVQITVVTQEALDHGSTFAWHEFWPQFLASTWENWQSEFLQLLVQAVLVASVMQRHVFRADWSADKDDVDRLERKLDRALARLGQDPDDPY